MNDDTHYDAEDPQSTDGNSSIQIELPDFKEWRVGQVYNYGENVVDYHNLIELDSVLNKARKALFLLTDKINEYERAEKLAKISYERAYRRAYLTSNEKTETAKRARAELKCEDLENEWLTFEQLKNELTRTSYTMRTELQTLQTIGNNLRQQLKAY